MNGAECGECGKIQCTYERPYRGFEVHPAKSESLEG